MARDGCGIWFHAVSLCRPLPRPTQAAVPRPTYPQYIKWAQETLDVRVHSNIVVEEMPAPFVRGVVARSRVPAGKPLISVPRASLLSLMTLDGHAIEPIMERYADMELREDDLLALMLLHEKHIAVRTPAPPQRRPACTRPTPAGRFLSVGAAHCAAARVL